MFEGPLQNQKVGLLKGKLVSIQSEFIEIASRKALKRKAVRNANGDRIGKQRLFRVDSAGYGGNMSSLRGNVLYFFMKNDSVSESQRALIDRKRALLANGAAPTFSKIEKLEIPKHLEDAFNALNVDQQNAVRLVAECNDYALIRGMPGTGKSSTICFLIRFLTAKGQKVLVSAYTNSALDHLCCKLLRHRDVKDKLVSTSTHSLSLSLSL